MKMNQHCKTCNQFNCQFHEIEKKSKEQFINGNKKEQQKAIKKFKKALKELGFNDCMKGKCICKRKETKNESKNTQ